MKRVSRVSKSRTLPEYAKSTGDLLVDSLRHAPRDMGDRRGPPARFDSVVAGGVALQGAREHAVQDRGNAEHVEDEIEIPVGDFSAPGATAIGGDVFAFA